MSKYALIFASSAIMGLNAFLIGRNLPILTPLLTFFHIIGLVAALVSFYFTCKVWYYQGKIDAHNEIKKITEQYK